MNYSNFWIANKHLKSLFQSFMSRLSDYSTHSVKEYEINLAIL